MSRAARVLIQHVAAVTAKWPLALGTEVTAELLKQLQVKAGFTSRNNSATPLQLAALTLQPELVLLLAKAADGSRPGEEYATLTFGDQSAVQAVDVPLVRALLCYDMLQKKLHLTE